MMLAQVVNDAKSTKPADLQKGFNAVNGFKGITGDLGFSEKNHITINAEQLTLVKYDAASKQWVEVKD
jgi:branched-chain amino acid transport system substrate-binding protein